MKKFYVILAAALGMTIASCTNTDYVGEVASQAKDPNAIGFGSGTNALVRAADFTGSAAADKLGNAMKVYGVKQNATTTTNYDKVFVNYSVKYDEGKKGNAEYNDGWYYVAAETGQTVKYWDYSSADYHFVAGSPVANFTYSLSAAGDITTATVTGLGGRLGPDVTVSATNDPVYVADPKTVAKANYRQEVNFTFRALQTKVRVGIYETIPGYRISSIQFYDNKTTPGTSNYVTLNSATDGYFQGGANVTGTVIYNWITTPSYTFTYTGGVTSRAYWQGGQFSTGVPAINSTDATNLYATTTMTSMDTNGYFIVMPTPSATTATPLTLKCDYTLTSTDGSGETINVKGATATIPDAYTKWEANKAYTYLFKISANTNGKTGSDNDPAGLYPITFDAVVINFEDNQVGTETTVSHPSITVYQDGDVVTNGITYKAGAITVKAMQGTTDVTSSYSWQYVKLTGTTFDYSQDYEKLGTGGTATSWTIGRLSNVEASSTYVIKAVYGSNVAYFVLVVGEAESGPANS